MELKSLLFTLTTAQVDSVIHELELMKAGYTVHYFIDHYDVNLYCFPYGLEEKREIDNIYLFSDSQVAYNHLFKNSKVKPIQLDEYFEEYLGLTDKVENVFTKDFPALRDKVISFSNQLLKDAKVSTKSEDFELIRDKLSVIISVAIGFSSKNLNSFKELIQNEELLIERRMYDAEFHAPLIVGSTLFQRLLDEFVPITEKEVLAEAAKKNLTTAGEIEASRIKHRLNAYNDAAAIYRTIATNENNDVNYESDTDQENDANYLSKERSPEKRIYYLLTSAASIEKVVSAVSNDPAIAPIMSRHILRSPAEIFCKLIFVKDDLDASIADLRKLKTLLDFRNKLGFTLREHDVLIERYLENVEAKRNSMENYGIMVSHHTILEQMTSALKTLGNSNRGVTDLVTILTKASAYIKKNQRNVGTWMKLMKLNLTELAFKDDVLRLIAGDKQLFKVRAYGLDPIESTNHQVPIVFNQHNIQSKALIKLLSEVSFFYTTRTPSDAHIYKFKSMIIDGIKSVQAEYSDPMDEEIRVFLIYMVIAVPKQQSIDFRGPDAYYEAAYKRATHLYRKYLFAHSQMSRNPLLIEFEYVMVWAARRTRKYKESLETCDVLIKKYPEDPRFPHGKCLAIYCMLAEKNSPRPDNYDISYDHAIRTAEDAIALYKYFQKKNVDYSAQSIAVLHNCLAHFYAAWAIDMADAKDPDCLDVVERGRMNLVILKELVKKEFSKYAEYRSTEALVEFAEYEAMKLNPELFVKVKFERKLRNALDLLDKSVDQLEKERKLESKDDHKSRYNSLKKQINKALDAEGNLAGRQ